MGIALQTSTMMKELGHVILSLTAVLCILSCVNADEEERARDKKLLPVFQVVKFPNDACAVTGGSKNGTCYTAEECSNKGGVNAGSCASGFGVCCTFTLNCGGSSSENCTYFDSATTVNEGACRAQICKCNSNICQIRLDFSALVITGPSTASTSIALNLAGQLAKTGIAVASTTQCLTDTFSITNQNTVPVICGTNSGFHVYFDASDSCNSLDFQLGNNAIGVSAAATRSWSIKVTQYACDYENKAPSGCTQWHFGSSGTNYVYTFNYQATSPKHLANQQQVICIRRESGNCQVCWSANAVTDVGVSGNPMTKAGVVLGTMCCNYGTAGLAIAIVGYDCLMIPGASKPADGKPAPPKICGTEIGLVSAAQAAIDIAGNQVTICSKSRPFRVIFHSDGYEAANEGDAKDEASTGNKGFKLRYYQLSC